MMIAENLKVKIANAFKVLFGITIEAKDIALQATRKEFAGTHTLVVFPFLQKTKSKNPEELGNKIGSYLQKESGMLESFNVLKGFLNFSINKKVWIETFQKILFDLGFFEFSSKNKKIVIEFSSPNTNKPLHLGHLRNNFLGDSVGNILSTYGYEVKKINLVNDRGIHICKSMLAYQKFGFGETPESSNTKGDHLVGKYYVRFDQWYKQEVQGLIEKGFSEEEEKKKANSIQEAQLTLKKWEENDTEVRNLWIQLNNWVYDGFQETYDKMGISFDKTYKESETYLLGKEMVKEGLKKQIFYKKEDNSVWVNLTNDGFDEKLLLRPDGTSVYMTQDLGTCGLRFQDFSFDKSIYVVGNEQNYHFKVLFLILKKLKKSYAKELYHLSYGMVDLPSGKMKSREGTVVDADDLILEMQKTAEIQIEELGRVDILTASEIKNLSRVIGLGALKYFLLRVDPQKKMLFNPQESIQFHGCTGPFIQYTHARIKAIMRRAESLEIGIQFAVGDSMDITQKEIELLEIIFNYRNIIKQAVQELSPSLLAQYVYDLAKSYNGFYQEIPIFDAPDKDLVSFRIALSEVSGRIISNLMNILAIDVPERM